MNRAGLLSILAACSTSDGGEHPVDAGADGCPLTVGLGQIEAGGYADLQEGGTVEVVLGFQGFLFVNLVVRVEGTDASEGEVTLSAEIEHLPLTFARELASLSKGPDGARYTHELQLLFSATSIAELVGREAVVSAGLNAGGCVGADEQRVQLVDESSCIEQPDGGVDCPDAA